MFTFLKSQPFNLTFKFSMLIFQLLTLDYTFCHQNWEFYLIVTFLQQNQNFLLLKSLILQSLSFC